MSAACVEPVAEPAFGRRASTYETSASVQAWLAGWLEEWLEPGWPAGCEVIEVGAGTGLFTRRLAGRGTLRAMDLCAGMVREGRERVPGVGWTQGDALKLGPGSCDRLYSSAMLQWVGDPRTAMQTWCEALRPGGRMLHGLFVSPTLPELGELEPSAMPLRWRDVGVWREAMERAGLRVLRWETRTVEALHVSALAFLRSLHATGVTPAKPRLGAGRLRQLLRAYDERHRCEEGGVRATWTALRIEAEKPPRLGEAAAG